jgi:hypothetical protein
MVRQFSGASNTFAQICFGQADFGPEFCKRLSREPTQFAFRNSDRGIILSVQIKAIAIGLCAMITDFEHVLKSDAGARERFMRARQSPAQLSQGEAMAWGSLVRAAGY